MTRFRLVAALCAASVIGACSHPILDTPQPPLAPKPDDVVKMVEDYEALLKQKNIADFHQKYTAAAYVTVEEKCGEFFDRLTLYKNNSSFYSTQIATAGAAAAGVLAILSASTTAIGLVGLGAGLAASTITNFQNFATVTPYPMETRQLVFAALEAAKTAKPASTVRDIYDARSTVAAYAQYCTYAGIVTLSQQAIERGAANVANATPTAAGLIRAQITTLVGGPLTDTQLAMVVVLEGLTSRQAAGDSAGYSATQKRVLFDGNNYVLSRTGRSVAALARSLALTSPGFEGLLRDLGSQWVGASSPPPPSAGRELLAPPLSPVAPGGAAPPVPTPRIIVR